jgi:hypothetical protein
MKIPVCSDMTLCVDHYIGSSVSVTTKLHARTYYMREGNGSSDTMQVGTVTCGMPKMKR